MSEDMSRKLDKLIDEGAYVTYADAIRHSLALLQKENNSKYSN
jgi:Arc/MetJ-type ribon-helix-helix transcriptional regulator